MFTLPANTVTDLTGYVQDVATEVWPLAVLAIGIPLGFYIVSKVIGLVRKHTK